MDKINWYVVQTKPHKENLAIENLRRQGFTTYCPQITLSKRRYHQWRKVKEPLFPRYLFVQLNVGIDNFAPIRSTLGVNGLVRFCNKPVVISELVIESIHRQEQEMNSDGIDGLFWNKGDVLEVIEGPFAGLKGIFLQQTGIERVSVLLDILGRQNRITLNINNLVPAY